MHWSAGALFPLFCPQPTVCITYGSAQAAASALSAAAPGRGCSVMALAHPSGKPHDRIEPDYALMVGLALASYAPCPSGQLVV
jgi:hypothetical protein